MEISTLYKSRLTPSTKFSVLIQPNAVALIKFSEKTRKEKEAVSSLKYVLVLICIAFASSSRNLMWYLFIGEAKLNMYVFETGIIINWVIWDATLFRDIFFLENDSWALWRMHYPANYCLIDSRANEFSQECSMLNIWIIKNTWWSRIVLLFNLHERETSRSDRTQSDNISIIKNTSDVSEYIDSKTLALLKKEEIMPH